MWVIRTEDGLFGGAAIYTQGNLPFDDESLLGGVSACLIRTVELTYHMAIVLPRISAQNSQHFKGYFTNY